MDVYLYGGAVNPYDVILRDPTTGGSTPASIVALGIASAEAFGNPTVSVSRYRMVLLVRAP